ncbi:rhomboid family intramembrane serine protease [Evansella clarkii]|jgi:membrane associated rhomboid family serine protease|uniref:rhomboid family intramembrane serine protease n=1 Tax=Evansella clarkii TaxID=79879 RepID=UPI00099893C2|nr:rhomboid family intramembrane serine protease [Evansella clarkii]
MFIRTESFGEFVRTYKVITGLVTIHIILHLWVSLFPALGGQEIRLLGMGSNLHIAMGEYWRLITPIFLHAGLMHMLFNSFSLVLFGPALEQMLGPVRFIIAYLATGILANVATFFFGSPMMIHVGASGAIFGLFGIYLYMVLMRKDLIDQGSSQVITTILIIAVIMTFVNPRVNILAHLFGLIAGAGLGPLILYGVSRYGRYRRPSSPDGLAFDPNRWQKKARNKQRLKTVSLLVGAILVILFFAQYFM